MRKQTLIVYSGVIFCTLNLSVSWAFSFTPNEDFLHQTAWQIVFVGLMSSALFLSLALYSDRLSLGLTGAQIVSTNLTSTRLGSLGGAIEALHELTEKLALPSQRLAIIPSLNVNALATGFGPRKGLIALTSGMLLRLSPNLVKAAIAHELSHISNRDVLYTTIVGTLLLTIVIVTSHYFADQMGYLLQFDIPHWKLALGLSVLFQMVGCLLSWLIFAALMRQRELLADYTAAGLVGYWPMIDLLRQLQNHNHVELDNCDEFNMYAASSLRAKCARLGSKFSLHPTLSKRVEVLTAHLR